MAAAVRRFLFALPAVIGALAMAGCDRGSTPTSPTPVPRAGSAGLVSLAIGGTTSLDGPGASGAVTAIATFADGTSREVTAEASWTVTQGWLTFSRPGTITATRYGTATLNARYLTQHANAWIRIAPAGSFLLHGSVTGAGGFRLPGARVEFSSGCGTHTAITDEFGAYILPAAGQAALRVQMNGFQTQVTQVAVGADGRFDVELQHVPATGSLSGQYRLTVSASPTCVLPGDVMQRRYDARILEVDRHLSVLLSGASFAVWGGEPGFTGSRDQDTVRFVVSDTFDDGYNFIEAIDPGRTLYYAGTAAGTADQARIVATFNGKLELRASVAGATSAWCVARDHRFEFTRSGANAAVITSAGR